MRSSSRRASSLLVVKSRTCLRQPPAAPRRLPMPPRRPQRKGEGGNTTPPGAGSPTLGCLKCMVCFIFCFSFIKKIRGIKLSSFVKVLRGERFGLSADIGQSQSQPWQLSEEDLAHSSANVLPPSQHTLCRTPQPWGEPDGRAARVSPALSRCISVSTAPRPGSPAASCLPVTPRFRGLDATSKPQPPLAETDRAEPQGCWHAGSQVSPTTTTAWRLPLPVPCSSLAVPLPSRFDQRSVLPPGFRILRRRTKRQLHLAQALLARPAP